MISTKWPETTERLRKEKLDREHKLINGIDHKICNKHHIFFPEENPWMPANTEYFYYSKCNETDHLHPNCKKCGIAKMHVWRDSNPDYLEKENKRTNRKYHNDPEFKQMIIDSSNKQREEGYQSDWRKGNPEKCIEYSKKHRHHDITEAEWRSCLEFFGNTCAYCGLPIEKHIVMRNGKYIIMKFHKEHVDDKGYNDLRNGVPACQRCNTSKHQDSLDEWYKKQKFFTMDKYIKILWWINEEYKYYIDNKPPYRIVRKKNENDNKFHWQLWTVNRFRNMIDCIEIRNNKKEIVRDMKNGIIKTPEII